MDSFYERVVRASDPDRLFAVQSNKDYGWYAGRLVRDDMQALIGVRWEQSILLLTFTNHGALYNIERITLPQFRRPPEEEYVLINDEELREFLSREYSFEAGLVRVNRFLVSDDRCGFRVGPFSWHYERFLANPHEDSAEEQQHYQQLIIEFIDRGAAVLDWGEEWYVLEADGTASK